MKKRELDLGTDRANEAAGSLKAEAPFGEEHRVWPAKNQVRGARQRDATTKGRSLRVHILPMGDNGHGIPEAVEPNARAGSRAQIGSLGLAAAKRAEQQLDVGQRVTLSDKPRQSMDQRLIGKAGLLRLLSL